MLNPRPCMPDFITPTCMGGGDTTPTRFETKVVELSNKNLRIALDEYSRLVVRFFILGQNLTQFLGVKGQIFLKSAFFQLCSSIFQKLSIAAS